MKKTVIIVIPVLVFVGLFLAFKSTPVSQWTLDSAHARLGFTATHMLVSDVDGMFKKFDVKLTTEKKDFSDAQVTMTAVVASIDTDNEKRDADLKSPSYFNALKYPLITFESRSFIKVDDSNYRVTGDMTIHGITKTVVLNALCKMGTNPNNKNEIAGFKVTGTLKRLDFGVGESTPAAIISNEIALLSNVELGRKPLP